MYLSLTNLITDSSFFSSSHPLFYILKFEQITTTFSLILVSMIISSGIILFLIDLGLFLSLQYKLKETKHKKYFISNEHEIVISSNKIETQSSSTRFTKLLIKEKIH